MTLFLLVCGLPLAAAATVVACGGDAFQAGANDAGGHPSDSGIAADTGMTVDTGSPPADAGPSWCSGQTTMFCEDFDEYSDINALLGGANSLWTTSEQTKGSFKLDTTNALSLPNALEAVGDDGAQILVVKTFSALAVLPKRMRLEFSLRVNDAGKVGVLSAVGFAAIAFGNSIDSGYAAMAIGNGPVLSAAWASSTGGFADAGDFKTANAPSGGFPAPGKWDNRYALQIDYVSGATATGCIQVYQGPTPLLSPCLPLPPQLLRAGVVSIALGDEAAGLNSTGQIDLEFDNVTFDITK